MYVLKAKILLKNFYLQFINNVEINKSIETLSDTAILKIPRRIFVKNKAGEKVRIVTLPYELKAFLGYRNFAMLDEKGEYIAKANSLWSLLDVATGKPVIVNEAMRKGYAADEKLDMDYAPRKITVPEGGQLLEPIVVKKHHLDTNHHVNNGQYVNIAMEYLPDDFVIRQMRAEYKKQAFLEDVLHPYVVQTENGYIICLQDEEGRPYVSVEFLQ
jgi:acyl-ACP thioesterase